MGLKNYSIVFDTCSYADLLKYMSALEWCSNNLDRSQWFVENTVNWGRIIKFSNNSDYVECLLRCL